MKTFTRTLLIMTVMVYGSVAAHSKDTKAAYVACSLFDSNATLLQQADAYIAQVDTFDDLLPPAGWPSTTEKYFEEYVYNKLGLQLADIHLGSRYRYKVVSDYVVCNMDRAKKYLQSAQACVASRAICFSSMANKLAEIKKLEQIVTQAPAHADLYNRFLLGHQILNFYQDLPIYDAVQSNNALWYTAQEKDIMQWISQGYYKNSMYPLAEHGMQFSRDLKCLESWFDGVRAQYYQDFPELSHQLKACQQKLQCARDILINSAAYKKESIAYQAYLAEESYKFNQNQLEYYTDQAASYRKRALEYTIKAQEYRTKACKYQDQSEFYLQQAQSAEKDAQYAKRNAQSAKQSGQDYAQQVKEYEQKMIKILQKKCTI